MHGMIRTLAALSVLPLLGCNQYEIFLASGQAQESFNNQAEILFIIDNSSSMTDESEALALNFDIFIRTLTDPSSGGSTDGLKDATDNYIGYVSQRGRFLDYQLAITTTDVEDSYGSLYALGDNPPILGRADGNVSDVFSANLLCTATCWLGEVPWDPEYECGDPLEGEVSEQYLDCTCGGDAWKNNCGSGNEEHLEAVSMAMCRAVESPPADCYDNPQFTDADINSNAGLIRSDTSVIPVIVTDEGDGSRRLNTGVSDASVYSDLFDQFNTRLGFAVIGPRTDKCNSGQATTWGVDRFYQMIDTYGGEYYFIAEEDEAGGCQVADFAVALEDLGNLLNSLLDVFKLNAVPNLDSIIVFVDGVEVDQAIEAENEDGILEYSDGWSYLAAENGIQFHGDTVPGYNADVQIYYLPLDGMPRTAPF